MSTSNQQLTFNPSRRSVLKSGLASTLVPVLGTCQNLEANNRSSSQYVDAFIGERMATYKVAGAGIARIEDGEVIWERGYGVTNIETGQRVTEKTLFQAASLSKPIFAYVAMQAVERGVIGLDDRLVDYARPAGLSDHVWSSEIRVRDALQHTTGLPNWRPMEETLPLVPAYKPGTDSSYSGEAYYWLQLALEAITGDGLDTIMREYLFEPAGLGDMSMLWEAARDGREVYGHTVDEDGNLRISDIQFAREQGQRLSCRALGAAS